MQFNLAYLEDAARRGVFTALATLVGALVVLQQQHQLTNHAALLAAGLGALAGLLSVLTHAVLDPILDGRIKALGGGLVGMMVLTLAQAYGAQVIAQLDSASPFDAKAWSALGVGVAAAAATLVQAALRQAAHAGPAPSLPQTAPDAGLFMSQAPVPDGTPGLADGAGSAPDPKPEA